MAQWLVTQGSNQFTVDGLSDLMALAQKGKLAGGDMIQPPGATDWVYAAEIPELKAMLVPSTDDDTDEHYGRNRMALAAPMIAAVLGGIAVVGGIAMFFLFQQLPGSNDSLLGAGGLSYSEMLVTDKGAQLLADPKGSRSVGALKKDQTLTLLAKRGDFYKARTEDGKEGWIGVTQTIPMYQLGGAEVREEYDPLYNPDRYVEVVNASWLQLPEQNDEEVITVFQFLLNNESAYPMTDLVILATIKNEKGHELEQVEIAVEGIIPANSGTMVGTLAAEDEEEPSRLLTNYSFRLLAKDDPELQLRFSDGVEVPMTSQNFTNANIDLIELRAEPDEKAAADVRRR